MSKFASEVSQLDKYEVKKQLEKRAIILIGCEHLNQGARGRRASNGAWYWTIQCPDCGLVYGDEESGSLQWVKQSHPLVLKASEYVEIDDDLRKATKSKIRFFVSYLYINRLRKDRKYIESEWFDYHRFLKSDEWQTIRKKVFDRDNGFCRLNYYCCTKEATIVHHLVYSRWRERNISDLVSCCRKCHEWEHPHLRGEDWL